MTAKKYPSSTGGRPRRSKLFCERNRAAICDLVKRGYTLSHAASRIDLVPRTVQSWYEKHQSFRDQVDMARAFSIARYQEKVESMIDSVDTSNPNAKVAELAWRMMARIDPDEFGDRAALEKARQDGMNALADIMLMTAPTDEIRDFVQDTLLRVGIERDLPSRLQELDEDDEGIEEVLKPDNNES